MVTIDFGEILPTKQQFTVTNLNIERSEDKPIKDSIILQSNRLVASGAWYMGQIHCLDIIIY